MLFFAVMPYNFCLLFLCRHESLAVSAMFFFVGASTRANGVVNAAFLLHFGLVKLAKERRFLAFLSALVATCLAASPFLLVQAWHISNFCQLDGPTSSTDEPTFDLVSTPAWCPSPGVLQGGVWPVVTALTRPYSYVQAQHWGVGFLASWRARKIPEFVVVVPIFLFAILRYLGAWFGDRRRDVISLGGILPLGTVDASKKKHVFNKLKRVEEFLDLCLPKQVAFWFHAVFLLAFGICYVYVLVSIIVDDEYDEDNDESPLSSHLCDYFEPPGLINFVKSTFGWCCQLAISSYCIRMKFASFSSVKASNFGPH